MSKQDIPPLWSEVHLPVLGRDGAARGVAVERDATRGARRASFSDCVAGDTCEWRCGCRFLCGPPMHAGSSRPSGRLYPCRNFAASWHAGWHALNNEPDVLVWGGPPHGDGAVLAGRP